MHTRHIPSVLVALFAGLASQGSLWAQPIIPDEDIPNASKDLREILYERHEVRERIAELENEKKNALEHLQFLDELVRFQKELDRLWPQISQAEKNGDEDLAKRLEKKSGQIEQEMRFRRSIAEVDEQIREYEPILKLLRAENAGEETIEIVSLLIKSLRSSKEIHEKLHPIYLNGRESADGPLEKKLETLQEVIEYNADLFGLMREHYEAQEEGETERAEELEEEIAERKQEAAAKKDEQRSLPPENKSVRQPISVTKEALMQFAIIDFDADIVPLLKTYCFECHSNATQSGELNVEQLITERPVVKNREKWINILEQTKNRVMPPEDADQPNEPHRTKLVLAVHNTIHNFDYTHIKNPGYESARRLTHAEYDNTIRDLLGVDLKTATHFPSDLVGTSGFDNSANTLFIQPLLMERYMGAAEAAVSVALPENPTTAMHRTAHDLVFGSASTDSAEPFQTARVVLRRFLQRAYRRPATSDELSRSVQQFQDARGKGLSFHDAIKAIIRTTLVSPKFLLKSEAMPAKSGDHRITDWELASRLSYFLWATMPDDQLFELASSGKLSDSETFLAQVDRMIVDSKSDSLGTIFAAQWLGSQHLGTRMRLDPIDNPWCTDTLMTSMRQETSMFFHALVRENEPIQRLIDADFTFMNEELARHYRMRGVHGDAMRRVALKEDDRRGGIFGQGSLLAVTSFPGRTSPVVRGRWILGDVLGTPPPPPPPNVSELSDEIQENRRLTFRQKLEVHRRSPNCYACHSQMDPLGFALENYDWFGRLRDQAGRRKARQKIDARGKLPNGTEFEGLAGLKKVILDQRMDDLIRQLSSKMLSYALGRQLEYYDEPAVRKIVAAVKADGNRFHTLLREVVMSYPFQYKRTPERANTDRVSSQHSPNGL